MAVISLIGDIFRAAHSCFPGFSPGRLKLKAQFAMNARSAPGLTRDLLSPAPGSALETVINGRPDIRGILIWPYQCNAWGVQKRLERFLTHYRLADQLEARYRFGINEKLRLLDLSEFSPQASIVLDHPYWFMREGGYTLNLFLGDFRAYSIAFSLFETSSGERAFYVGGLQGRNREDALEVYRAQTKAFFGLRPRDLLVENIRLLANHWGAQKIICVSDARRHHRHKYFEGKVILNDIYDSTWTDRGGHQTSEGDFDLPLIRPDRPLDSIPAKKRSLYRKRYAFLDQISASAEAGYPDATPVTIEAT